MKAGCSGTGYCEMHCGPVDAPASNEDETTPKFALKAPCKIRGSPAVVIWPNGLEVSFSGFCRVFDRESSFLW